MIRAVCLRHDETKQGVMAAVNSDMPLYTFRPEKDMTCDKYLKLFRAQVLPSMHMVGKQDSTGSPTRLR